MTIPLNGVAFFDIGNTLASVRVSATEPIIEEMTVFPGIPRILRELRENGVRLGILSDRGPIPADNVNQALERSQLLQFFDRKLILYGRKDSTILFERAAGRVGPTIRGIFGPTLLFVGEDANERAQARAVNFLVAPHPRLALSVLTRQNRVQAGIT